MRIPFNVEPELAAAIEAEVDRLRAERPELNRTIWIKELIRAALAKQTKRPK